MQQPLYFSPNQDINGKFTILSATEAVYQHTSRYKTAIFNYNIMTSRDRTRTLLPKIGTQTVHVWNLWIQNAMQFFQLVCITGHEPMTIVWDTTGISYPTLKTILVFILRMRVCGIYGLNFNFVSIIS